MLIGCDLSLWNTGISPNLGDFQIHKITEGNNITDPRFIQWWTARQQFPDALNGIYHYMSTQDIHEQAQYFINACHDYDVDRVMVCLDFEGGASVLDTEGTNIIEFFNYIAVKGYTVQPVVYCDISVLERLMGGRYATEFSTSYSFWIADYGSRLLQPVYKFGGFNTVPVMRQFTSVPICDMDIFYGSISGFKDFMNATDLKGGE